jgi:hypothetical protein
MTETELKEIMALLVPHQAKGYDKVRIGQPFDGGYIHVDDFKDIKLGIGGGLNNDDSWELAMLEKGIPVMAFDHTDGYIYQNQDRGYDWFKMPMQGYATNSTLDLILPAYPDHSVIAKIDIEGDEWEMFRLTKQENLNKLRQIVVEFHNFPMFETALATFKQLSEKFRVVHVHGNNCDICNEYQGQNLPRVIEFTLVNKDYYDLSISKEIFPGALDAANNPHASDFYLGEFTL